MGVGVTPVRSGDGIITEEEPARLDADAEGTDEDLGQSGTVSCCSTEPRPARSGSAVVVAGARQTGEDNGCSTEAEPTRSGNVDVTVVDTAARCSVDCGGCWSEVEPTRPCSSVMEVADAS